ncbi:MAG: DDE-type integrase/transposase/recombinase [Gammaproteobacteria bacterium]|nr:DDE-type integrase/transposase/recombinase [Gammaproteobacteria bacterium]
MTPSKIKIADGKLVDAVGSGSLRVTLSVNGESRNVVLRDCLFVPKLQYTLWSIRQTTKKGYKVLFDNKGVTVSNKFGDVVCIGKLQNKLYQVDGALNMGGGGLDSTKNYPSDESLSCDEPKSLNSSQSGEMGVRKCCELEDCYSAVSAEIWHKRFAHVNPVALQKLSATGCVKNLSVTGSIKDQSFCDACAEGKAHVLPFPSKTETCTECVLEKWHVDLMGPFEIKSVGGKSYCMVVVDDFSRYVWVRFLAQKSDAFEAFRKLLLEEENQKDRKLKCLRSDRGGEFINKPFSDFLEQRGVRRELSVAEAKQQNGVAERMNRTLMERARAMLRASRLPKSFWAEAIATACYVRNRCPSRTLATDLSVTPHELYVGSKPTVRHLRVFGCVAFAHIPGNQRRKLDSKAQRCVFLGYSLTSKGYRLWNVKEHKVITRRDVIFDENLMGRIESPRTRTTDLEQNEDPESVVIFPAEPALPPVPQQAPDPVQAVPQAPVNPQAQPVGRRYPGRDRAGVPPVRFGIDEYVAVADSVDMEPRSWKEAMKSPEVEKWREAAQIEYNSLLKHETWDLCSLPADKNVVACRWVFKVKRDEHGAVERFKARLVAKGFSQKYGEDYLEIFAPVTRQDSVWALISVAVQHGLKLHQFDVETAFLNGNLSEEIYMHQPEGFVKPGEEKLVCRLKKSLYGLKQSPRCWNIILDEHLCELGFVRSKNDPCIYTRMVDGELVLLAVYVDDIILAAKSDSVIQSVKNSFSERFGIKDLGPLHYFLGMQVHQSTEGVWLGQPQYSKKVLEKFQMADCIKAATPMETGAVLVQKPEDSKKFENPTVFQSAIGSLLYLANCTRPDLSYSVHKLAQFAKDPYGVHWKAVKRVLAYVKGTLDLGIKFQADSEEYLVAYADADYAGDLDKRRSTSGNVMFCGGAPIAWLSQKQPVVALSTAEAEYVSLCESSKKIVWLRRLLGDLGLEQKQPTVVYEDNQATMALADNPGMYPKVKHIATRFHFVREAVENGEVKVEFCPSVDMVADILTKPLPKESFFKFRSSLGLVSEN